MVVGAALGEKDGLVFRCQPRVAGGPALRDLRTLSWTRILEWGDRECLTSSSYHIKLKVTRAMNKQKFIVSVTPITAGENL